MSLKDQISIDLKNAMKNQDKETTSALRMVLSELKYAQSSGDSKVELGDAEVEKVVGSYQKKLEKSLDEYPQGESRNAILKEIEIVSRYLPKKASKEEVETVVSRVLGATDERNFGKLMKLCIAELGASAEGKLVSEVLKSRLQG